MAKQNLAIDCSIVTRIGLELKMFTLDSRI